MIVTYRLAGEWRLAVEKRLRSDSAGARPVRIGTPVALSLR
jgi:hypothetical protein